MNYTATYLIHILLLVTFGVLFAVRASRKKISLSVSIAIYVLLGYQIFYKFAWFMFYFIANFTYSNTNMYLSSLANILPYLVDFQTIPVMILMFVTIVKLINTHKQRKYATLMQRENNP